MKKNLIYALMSAIALTGAVGLSSCTDEEMAEVNPTYNPETGEVNVDFVFNVSTANEPFSTRMSSANTQAATTDAFRGITDAYLAAFSQTKTDGKNDDGLYVTNAALTANKLHNLGPVIGAGKLNPNQVAVNDVTQSHRVLQLSLAQGTNSLMFWGKAVKDGTDLEQGKIAMNIADKPENTKISMCKIVPTTAYTTDGVDQATLGNYQKLLAAVLTYIINSGVTNKEVTFGNTLKTVTLSWKDYVTVTGDAGSYKLVTPKKDPSDGTKALSLLAERLNFTFMRLNTIHSGELRAGCGLAIADMVTDVMANINQVITATPLNMEEAVAQEVAKDIKARVDKFFEISNGKYVWQTTSAVKTAAASFVGDDVRNAISDSHKLIEFPAFFNLPLGSTILQLAIVAATSPDTGYTYTYNYSGSVETYAMGGQSGDTNTAFNPENYMYPAELCYFGNSAIRVSDQTKAAGDYPDGVANWEASTSWGTDWTTNSHVASSTRSVAMKDNINYGTALLESRVKYGATTLQDNNHNLQWAWSNHTVDEPNNTIDVDTRNDHFVLTGILVGGQNPDVGWNYIAKGTATGFGAMVYDKAKSTVNSKEVNYIEIPKATSTGGSSSEAMYTLLWDNWDANLKGQKQRDVYIAVEFQNNSKDFYGENNLIRNGATFYIVGKLDPNSIPTGFKIPEGEDNEGILLSNAVSADKTLYGNHLNWGVTWPTNYALPPYDTDGSTIKERRVFMQDFVTKVTFVIGEESLQHALVSVPDLRSGQISLGLSVDLNWRTGINFGEVILGQK